MKKLLFICSKNKLRSPTAEAVFCDIEGWEVASAGVSRDAEVRVSLEDVEWADIIFVMEKAHKRKLSALFASTLREQQVIVLNISDDYQYMDPELIEILKLKVPSLVR